MFFLEKARKKAVKAFTMEESSTPPNYVFFRHDYMKHTGPAWRRKHKLENHNYFIPVQNALKDEITLAQGRSFSFRAALNMNITEHGSGHSTPPDSESMDSDSNISDGADMVIDNGNDNRS